MASTAIAGRDCIDVLTLKRLDPANREHVVIEPGLTLAELVDRVLPGLTEIACVRVILGDQLIQRDLWHRVRPKRGTTVIVRMLPCNDTRSILGLVVTIAAVAVGGALGAPVAGAFGLTGAVATGAVQAGISLSIALAGNYALNALVPLRTDISKPSDAAASPTYSINGFRNSLTPRNVIPNVLGKHRFAPPYATQPYTSIDTNNQYVNVIFNFGYGPLVIEDLKIGDTAIGNFIGVQTETRQGYITDDLISLIPEQRFEIAPAGDFPSAAPTAAPQINTTPNRDATAFSVDIIFPRGLGTFNDSGGIGNRNVTIRIRYKASTSSTWITWGEMSITRATRDVVRVTQLVSPLAADQYDVEISRTSSTSSDFHVVEDFTWVALRGHRGTYPLNSAAPLALVALIVRASDQLNGMVENFNAVVTRICLDWDTDTNGWIERATQNPASLFRYVLQSPANAYPKADSEIDLEMLAEWHVHCQAEGLKYNRVHDFKASLWDVLSDVAAAGHASPRHDGSRWTVVIDEDQAIVAAHITSRNSWGFQIERPHIQFPDALRASYTDETNGWLQAEQIVNWPGFVGDPDVIEELQFPGITDPALIVVELSRQAQRTLIRADTYTVNQDIENLVVTRGDLVALSHDTLDRTQVAARVRNVNGNWITIDEVVTVDPLETYACRFRLSDGTSVLRTVSHITVGSESSALLLAGSGTFPEIGDLAMFGRASFEVRAVRVVGVEVQENHTARIRMVDADQPLA